MRKVSAPVAIAIFILPILFSWLTLRKGHTVLSRVLAFGWLATFIYSYQSGLLEDLFSTGGSF